MAGDRAAQPAGAVSQRFAPEMLLLVVTLTRIDAAGSPEINSGTMRKAPVRLALADAVRRLVS